MVIPRKIQFGVEQLILRLPAVGACSKAIDFEQLINHESYSIPGWLVALFAEYPLAGVQIGTSAGGNYGAERSMFEIGDSTLINELNTTSYPGMHLFPRGYVAIGCGIEWAGDVLVLATKDDLDQRVYQVWHDVSQDADELEMALLNSEPGTQLISETFSDLLQFGLAEPPFMP